MGFGGGGRHDGRCGREEGSAGRTSEESNAWACGCDVTEDVKTTSSKRYRHADARGDGMSRGVNGIYVVVLEVGLIEFTTSDDDQSKRLVRKQK